MIKYVRHVSYSELPNLLQRYLLTIYSMATRLPYGTYLLHMLDIITGIDIHVRKKYGYEFAPKI